MTDVPSNRKRAPTVVIVGGGFGGLYAARALAGAPVEVRLVDRRNFHLFQPLLYQVATGGLSPADISSPLRAVLRRQKNVSVFQADVTDIDLEGMRISTSIGDIRFDYLVLATGATHHYFGHPEWAASAPGLKTIEDATTIRSRILRAFEKAESETDPAARPALMTFVVVGGGPTGVEMAGAIGELATQTLGGDFRIIDPSASRILLVEGLERILPTYPDSLSQSAVAALERLGVSVMTRTLVTGIEGTRVTLKRDGHQDVFDAANVIWAAGVKASPLGRILADKGSAELDRSGRVVVEPDCSVPGCPQVFVIGDLACYRERTGEDPLPGVAPVAMQQGAYVARVIRDRLWGCASPPFRYRDMGSLAVIGRAAAVAHRGRFRFSGYPAWLLWLFVHLMYLVGFRNRLVVLIQWAWSYVTRNRGARLITGAEDAEPTFRE